MCTKAKNAGRVFDRCFRCKKTAAEIEAVGERITANGYCLPCYREYGKERNKRPDVKEKNLATHEVYRKRRPDLVNARARRRNARIKREVFAHYGNRCACCGEHRIEFLSVDHVNGDGAEHRRSGVGPGIKMYYWLQRNSYPGGYRVLCMSCNCAIAKFGVCPHERIKSASSNTDADL